MSIHPPDPDCACLDVGDSLRAAIEGIDPPLCPTHQSDEITALETQAEVDAAVARIERTTDLIGDGPAPNVLPLNASADRMAQAMGFAVGAAGYFSDGPDAA